MPIGPPNLDLYSIPGARYFNDGLSITPKVPVFGFLHSASANKDWVDPIVGLTGRYRIDDNWFANAEGDIGGPQQQRRRPRGRPASCPAKRSGMLRVIPISPVDRLSSGGRLVPRPNVYCDGH
jgi:hypothetical protein